MLHIQLFIISVETWEGSPVCWALWSVTIQVCMDAVVMVKDVPKSQKAPQQQQLPKQWNQH